MFFMNYAPGFEFPVEIGSCRHYQMFPLMWRVAPAIDYSRGISNGCGMVTGNHETLKTLKP